MAATTSTPARSGVQENTRTSAEMILGLCFVFLISVVVLFSRFAPGTSLISFFDDDFFYYAMVAKNLALHGVSTFDGIHLTNGYHPLWLLTLTGFFRLSTGLGFFYLVEGITLLSICAVYILSYRCLRDRGANQTWAAIISALLAMLCLNLVKGGMEPTLTFPLLLLFFWYRLRPEFRWTGGQAAVLGFVGSIVILSRLDSGIVVALLFICDAVISGGTIKAWVKRGLMYSLGAFLVAVYLYVNRVVFGTFMPISGEAKELRLHHFPSSAPLVSLFHAFHPLKPGIALPILFGLAAELALFALLIRGRKAKRDRAVLTIAWSLFLFPVIHIALLSLLSDWQLWIWYFYPFVVSVFGAALLATETLGSLKQEAPRSMQRIGWAFLIVSISAYTAALQVKLWRAAKSNDIVATARDLHVFASTHPGIYGMGDRSGLPAWSISSPMIQLEGLVMDKAYLNYLRQSPNLVDLLRRYHVRYYVGTDLKREGGCYLAVEPQQAGRDSIKSEALLCTGPVARFVHDRTETDVFDVSALPQAADQLSALSHSSN